LLPRLLENHSINEGFERKDSGPDPSFVTPRSIPLEFFGGDTCEAANIFSRAWTKGGFSF
jgi:hypothetical protein